MRKIIRFTFSYLYNNQKKREKKIKRDKETKIHVK